MTDSNDEESMKILPPICFNQTNGECTVLVQIDPQDSSTLDFTGATGAIGRMEADDTGVSFDFKGVQYRGTFYPTATTVVLAVVNGKENHLKIDGIADDFCYLEKTGESFKKFGNHSTGDMSEYYMQDEDVNRTALASKNKSSDGALLDTKAANPGNTASGKPQAVKAKRSTPRKPSFSSSSKMKKHKN